MGVAEARVRHGGTPEPHRVPTGKPDEGRLAAVSASHDYPVHDLPCCMKMGSCATHAAGPGQNGSQGGHRERIPPSWAFILRVALWIVNRHDGAVQNSPKQGRVFPRGGSANQRSDVRHSCMGRSNNLADPQHSSGRNRRPGPARKGITRLNRVHGLSGWSGAVNCPV